MAEEGTYEYECMRAELLGIEKPDYETFVQKKQEEAEAERKDVEEEKIDAENLKACETLDDSTKRIAGGLEEINNILSITQKKIDRFKVRCNSITSLLKMKVGSLSGGEVTDDSVTKQETEEEPQQRREPPEGANSETGDEREPGNDRGSSSSASQRKTDLAKALDNQVDRLDSMLDSADNAYHSMRGQNKQIKRFLK